MFDELYYWLILGSDLNESLSLINDNSFGVSTDFVLAIFKENQCILYDIYNPCKVRGGTLKTTRLGFWNESSGLNIVLDLNKARRWNLEGMRIKISGLVRKYYFSLFDNVETILCNEFIWTDVYYSSNVFLGEKEAFEYACT